MRRGFTLVELVLVITLTMILAGVALGELRGVQTWRAAAAVRRVQSDLLYARDTALLSGRRTLCVFDTANKTYELRQEAAPGTGAIAANLLSQPANGLAWQVRLANLASGLSLSFSPTLNPTEIGFDTAGLPIQRTGAALTSDITLTLGSAGSVTVRAGSGLAEVSEP